MKSLRQSGPKGNLSRFAKRTSAEPMQALERRMMLAASVGSSFVGPIRTNSATLVDLAKLPKSSAQAMTQAGASMYQFTTIGASANGSKQSLSLNAAAPFTLDLPALKQTLANAPLEFTAAASSNPLTLAFPMPNGSFARFKVVEAPIMEAGLANQLPGVKTFRGQGIDDPAASVRFDYTPLGFHAQILSPNGSVYIDPFYLNDANGTYVSYYKRDAIRQGTFQYLEDDDLQSNFQIGLGSQTVANLNSFSLDAAPFGGTLKTYRACVAATGEYTVAVGGGTQSGGQAAIVTAMNRVTQVYESELAIRMTLIANNINVVYTNGATDPYTNNNGSTMLNQNISNLNSVIGNANFDIGHVFSTGGGGVAFLGVVGTSSKAGGVTGLPSPIGDPFYIDYVAHEMGHQFGANHTFNTSNDTGNRSAAHAYEPGSGSTIMGYAGIEGAEDLQSNSDPYFHSDSIDAIRSFITNSIPSVGTATSTGNSPPTISAGSNYTIPTGTPFALTATGSDIDGDTVTYDWQQRDLGPATLLTTADNGSSPIFRAWAPTTNPTRTLPRLAGILNGTNVTNNASGRPVEKLYAVARTSNWRVIARDNRSGGGGVSSADMVLTVVNTGAGSFLVTSQNSFVTWTGGQTQTVTWNVAGTTTNGINAATVNIKLSLDGGNTFPITLAGNTANDGTEQIQVPFDTGSTQARIKVEAVGNIFFDINNANFTVVNVPISQVPPGKPALQSGSDTGVFNNDNITRLNNSSGGNTLTFDVPDTVNGAAIALYANGVLIGTGTGNGGTASITTNGTTTIPNGNISITARQTQSGNPQSADSQVLAITVDTVAPTLASTPTFAFVPSQSLTFQFSEDLNASITASGAGTLGLQNLTTSSSVSAGSMQVNYNSGTKTAVYTFPGLAGAKLSDGSYAATALATDLAGNPVNASSYNFIYAGGSTAHTFYVRRSDGGGANVEVYKNTPPDGSPDFEAAYGTLSQIALDGSSGDDTCTVDFVNGDPVPPGFLSFRFVGGAGNDIFNVLNPGTFYMDMDPLVDTQNMTLNVSAGATVEFGAIRSHLTAINLDGGNVRIPTAGFIVLITKSLSIANGGSLDLNDNDMIINYTGGSPLATIASYIASARSGGTWNGTGLTSTVAKNAVPKITTLGTLEGTEFKAIYGPSATFSSEQVTNTSVLVKYTYYGDADLNGRVNFDDYARTDVGFSQSRTGWVNGDFDGNGVVNFDDYSLIDLAFNSQGVVL